MPLPLTVSCFTEIQTGITILVPAHPGSPGQRAVKRVCVCVCSQTDITSTWTSGVVGPLHVNEAALDGVALVSQAVTSASCGGVIGARDTWLSVSACDSES